MNNSPNHSWGGRGKSDGVSNYFIEAPFDNPNRIHAQTKDWNLNPHPGAPERTAEQRLAAEVLLLAWLDATTANYITSSAGNACGIRLEARAFLTAKLPDPRAARRQLFTSILSLDDDAVRERAEQRLGPCPSVPPNYDPTEYFGRGASKQQSRKDEFTSE